MKHGKRTELGVDFILERIRKGDLQPGDRLPAEPDLAEELGLSRATLRQILKTLQTAGIIEARPRAGTVLKRPDPSAIAPFFFAHLDLADVSLRETAEARVSFEPGIAALAARYRKKSDLERIERTLDAARTSGTDWDAVVAGEREFHSGIVAASHNLILQSFNRILSLYFDRVSRPEQGNVSDDEADRVLTSHSRIYEAVKNGSALQAEALMKKHLERIAKHG